MKFRKKLLIAVIWILLLNIIIMFFYTDTIKDLKNSLIFKSKYYRKTIVETNLNYGDISRNNIISKNNFSVQLSNLNYDKENNSLKLQFDFYTNDKKILRGIDYILAIYDSKKMLYLEGNNIDEKNIKYIIKEKPYKNLDKTRIESDYIFFFQHEKGSSSQSETQKTLEIELLLEDKYEITDKLYIDFCDLTYQTIDDFVSQKVMKPFGIYRFIVDFN